MSDGDNGPQQLGSIRVVSKRKGGVAAAPDEVVIDIDRTTNAVLRNRHILSNHRDDDERKQRIESFEVDLDADIARGGPMSHALEEIADRVRLGQKVALRCWCAPKPCHGGVIRKRVYAMCGLAAPDEEDVDQSAQRQQSLF